MTEERQSLDNELPVAPIAAQGMAVGIRNKHSPVMTLEEEERRRKMPKTTGEWVYDNIQFWFVKGLILAATAGIGYYAKFGKETNVIRKFQQWCQKTIAVPLGEAGEKAGKSLEKSIGGKTGEWIGGKAHEIIAVFGGAFASTMVLFHGGNIVAPIVQWFENHRGDIVHGANQRWGKPGELESGDEKFAGEPKQYFGDVVIGRIVAWMTVFGSFFTGFLLLGKMKHIDNPKMYRLDYLEETMARAVTGFGKNSKFADIPMNKEIHHAASENPALFAGHEKNVFWYKVSRILALDIFATSASIIVWALASRDSARKRMYGTQHHPKAVEDATVLHHAREPVRAPESDEADKGDTKDDDKLKPSHAEKIRDEKKPQEHAKPRAESHGETVKQRQAEEPVTVAV